MRPDQSETTCRSTATSTSPVSHLLLLRHGESAPFARSDELRPLTAQGRAQLSREASRIISQLHSVLECSTALQSSTPKATSLIVWISPARRTQETWAQLAPEVELLVNELDISIKVEVIEELYLASTSQLRRLLTPYETSSGAARPQAPSALWIIGHNPGLSELISELTSTSDPERGLASLPLTPGAWVLLKARAGGWELGRS